MEPVGITNACTSVVVPNSSRMTVMVHSATKPRYAGEATVFGRRRRLLLLADRYLNLFWVHRYLF